jgi:nitrate reductase beta subunit
MPSSSRLYIAPEGHEATHNWEDDLAGGHVTGPKDPNIQKIEEDIKFQFDETFMMYLPRL